MKFLLLFLVVSSVDIGYSFEYNDDFDPLYTNNTGIYQKNTTLLLYKLQNITLNRDYFNVSEPSFINSISIIRTSIISIESKTFENFTNLINFSFNFNFGLSNLPDNIFSANNKIKSVTAVSNNFHQLKNNTFSHLMNLEELDLSNNQISDLPLNIFDSLLSLRTISLKRNNLKEVHLGIFDDLIHLRSIDLSYNDIKRVNPHIFKYNYHLESVNLQGNKIKKVDHTVLHLNVKLFYLVGNPLEKHDAKLLETLDGLHAQGVKTGVHQKDKPHHEKHVNSTLNIIVFGLVIIVTFLVALMGYLVYLMRFSHNQRTTGRKYYGMRSLSTEQLRDEDPWLDADLGEDRRQNIIVNASV